MHEHDTMACRSCGKEERASEGYPCATCGTFLCVMCSLRGVIWCRTCAVQAGLTLGVSPGAPPAVPA